MRRFFFTLLFGGITLAPSFAAPAPRPATITLHCAHKDLAVVLRKISTSMGRNLYIAPGVDGEVTADFTKYPSELALGLVLHMQQNKYIYTIIGNTIIVGTPEKVHKIPANILDSK